jgi:hypothetical protein
MEPTFETVSQLGIGLATLFILWFVVKYFVKAIEKKDTQIQEMLKCWHKVVTNHIDHQTKAASKQTNALDALTNAINALIIKLEK